MASDNKKPRAQRARRAAAALSVVAALSLGGAMAWSDTGTTSARRSTAATANGSRRRLVQLVEHERNLRRRLRLRQRRLLLERPVVVQHDSNSGSTSTVTPHTSTGGS